MVGIQASNARKEDACEKSTVGQTETQLLDQYGNALGTGRLFDESDDGLDVRAKPDFVGTWRRLFGSESAQTAQRRYVS